MANLDSRYLEGKIKGHIRSNFSNQNYAALTYEKIRDRVLAEYQNKDLIEAEEKFDKVFEDIKQKDDIKNVRRKLDIYVLAGQDIAIGEKEYNLGFLSFILTFIFIFINSNYLLIFKEMGPMETLTSFALIYVFLSLVKPYVENPNIKLFAKHYKISIITLAIVLVLSYSIYLFYSEILPIAILAGSLIFLIARSWEEKRLRDEK